MISGGMGAVKTGISIAPTQQQSARVKPPSVSILVLGCSGSGKTTFIDSLPTEAEQNTSLVAKTATLGVHSKKILMNDQEYEFIDTPGFDNPSMSDYKVFTTIAEYLLNESKIRRGMTGVVFVHRAGDRLESRALLRNARVIFEVFLGNYWFPRLTILIMPGGVGVERSTSRAAMAYPSSAFTQAIAGGATIAVPDSGQVNFRDILKPYSTAKRGHLLIQVNYINDPHTQVGALIESCLGYTENKSVQLRLEDRTNQMRHAHQEELSALRSSLRQSEEIVSQISERLQQVETDLMSQRDERILLQQQLQRTQTEYASLRSQLQLQENIEQSDIVQTLKDLNRHIDNLGRSISEFLVDNYVRTPAGTNPEEITALHAQHLPELKVLLGHSDRHSSLVNSSTGAGMRIEDFLDYAIRSLLCRHLCKRIFYPFHPGADPSHSDILEDIYDGVRLKVY
ncbi:hypothetical protein BDV93DRAFT_326088 [Ceratobasidium sp. AG-I]|nr:hypothetical protein BDV93DRAFT_326088 [Ceratobasidium sp. AG-I]